MGHNCRRNQWRNGYGIGEVNITYIHVNVQLVGWQYFKLFQKQKILVCHVAPDTDITSSHKKFKKITNSHF